MMFARYFVFGVAAGVVWSVLRGLLPMPSSAILAAALLYPICEETVRAIAVRVGQRRAAQQRLAPPLALGLGFGLWEAWPRWYYVSEPLGGTQFVGTLVPVALHITLTLLLWRWSQKDRLLVGFLVCVAIHVLHNSYVLFVVAHYNSAGFSVDVLARLVLLGSAIGALTSKR